MSFKKTYQIITKSKVYKDFIKENPKAEICAGFFITDFFGNDNKKSIDFKINEKIFTFSLDDNDEVKINEDKLIQEKGIKYPELKNLDPDIKVDLDEAEGIAKTRTLDEGIHAKFNKIISVLQKYEHNGKLRDIWNLTCMLEGLIILHLLIDAESGDIIKFERKSMMDLIRKK